MAKNDEKELLETYRKMIPENKDHFLAHARVALSAQETAKEAMRHNKLDGKRRKATA